MFKAVFKREKRALPTDNDLEAAALTLLDLWDIYDLDLEQLVKGKIRDIQGERLSADDIFFVASTARDAGKYYGAIKWFEYLLLMVRNGDIKASFRKQNLYRKLAASYQEVCFFLLLVAFHLLNFYQNMCSYKDELQK